MAVCKVPASDMEALKSNLMGLFEKKRVVGLYKYIGKVDRDDKNTWGDINLKNQPMKDVFEKHGRTHDTQAECFVVRAPRPLTRQ